MTRRKTSSFWGKHKETIIPVCMLVAMISFLSNKDKKPEPKFIYTGSSYYEESSSFKYGYDLGLEGGKYGEYYCSDLKGDANAGCEAGYQAASRDD